MKNTRIAALLVLLTGSLLQSLLAEEPEALIERGKLILSDDFNRPAESGLGKEWSVGEKSGTATMTGTTIVVEMAEGSGHSVSVKHDAPFDDGVVKVRFKLFDKLGLKLNFNDPKANKITWAGHVARVVAQPEKITISDDMTGVYELGIRAKRQDKSLPADEKAELDKFIKAKQPVFEAPIKREHWHEMTVVFLGPKVDVYLDGASVGSFSSEGLDHKVKQNVVFGVGGKVEVDEIRVWSLD